MRVPQIVTDREAWLAERRKRLNASEIAAILGLSPHATAGEVWLDKMGRLDPLPGNDAIALGHAIEGPLLDIAERQLGPLKRQARFVDEDSILAATLDGWLMDLGEAVEAKTYGLLNPMADTDEWGDDHSDQVPAQYWIQCQVQMRCSGAELAHLYALVAGRGMLRYRIAGDRKVQEQIIEFCAQWWRNHVIAKQAPESLRLPLDVLRRVRREPGSTVELPNEAIDMLDRYEAAKDATREAREQQESLRAELLVMLGDCEAGRLPDGRQVTFSTVKRRGYTVDATEYRQFRIRKAKG